KIERRAGSAATRRADRRSTVFNPFGRGDHCFIAERARRSWRGRVLRGIEHVRTAAGWRRRRHVPRAHGRRLCWRGSPTPRSPLFKAIGWIVLHAAELHLELLVSLLQLLDGVGELPQHTFHAVESN